MFPIFWIMLALVSDETELRKVLEFQYQQKLASITHENNLLKAEVKKLKTAQFASCSSAEATEVLHLNAKSKTAESKTNEQNSYRDALKLVQNEQWDDAILAFESFAQQFPESSLADHAIYWIAQVYIQKNEIGLARAELERLIKTYPRGERAKRAQTRLLSLPSATAQSDKPVEPAN